jgi:hypothetical protein
MVVKSCNFDWITFNKNVIRFPVEKRANQIEDEKKKKKRK